ncbi:MAG: four helix bundle protein [Patescibacteria group bacterium]
MSLIHEAPVFQVVYDLLKRIHLLRKRFEKSEKYSLGSTLEESSLETLLAIVEAGRQKQEWKIGSIDRALMSLEKLQILVRLAHDLKQIPERAYIDLQTSIQQAGRMLGGWRKKA